MYGGRFHDLEAHVASKSLVCILHNGVVREAWAHGVLSCPTRMPYRVCSSAAHPARVLKCPQTICPEQAPCRVRHRGAAPVQAPMRVGHSSALVKSQLIINGVITPISIGLYPQLPIYFWPFIGVIAPFVTKVGAPPCTNLSWRRFSNLLVIYQL